MDHLITQIIVKKLQIHPQRQKQRPLFSNQIQSKLKIKTKNSIIFNTVKNVVEKFCKLFNFA